MTADPDPSSGPDGPAAPDQHDEADELPLLGERPSIELANSLYLTDDEEVDFLAPPAAAGAWVIGLCAAEAWAPPPTDHDPGAATALQQLRWAVRSLVITAVDVGDPDQEAVAVVNAEAASGADRPVLRWRGRERPRAEVAGELADAAALRARLAADAIDLLAGDDRVRIRRCANPPCPMLFVAGHGRRRFCHPGCSHVVRQQRYRHRSSGP